LTELDQLNDTLHLGSIGCEIPLREIYAKMQLVAFQSQFS
jgi:hypothetical protein